MHDDMLPGTNTYDVHRDSMRPGDLIAFGGKGRASAIIKRFTNSTVSHIGLVRHVQVVDEPGFRYFNEIVESTTLGGISGVQTSRLSRRLEQYEGEAWWLALNDSAPFRLDETAYWDWLYAQEGKLYDLPQAILAGIDFLDGIGLTLAKEDFGKLFCSELGAGALREAGALFVSFTDRAAKLGGVVPDKRTVCRNASEETPIQLCQRPIWKPPVQLVGEKTEIR